MIGEHIRILKGGRWIHAVDCGDETVLVLAEETPPPRVRRAYRPEFVAGSAAVEVVTHRERTFPAKEIVRRAYSRASDPALAAMFRDSEAFVEWCTTGRLAGARNVAVEPVVPGGPAPAPATPTPAAPAARAARAAARPRKAAGTAARAKARPAARAKAKPKPKPARRAPRRAAPKATRTAPRKGARKAARRPATARKGRR